MRVRPLARFAPLVAVAVVSALAGCGSDVDRPTPAPGLTPPPVGVQLHVNRFAVPAGTEVQHCYYFKLPSDVDLEVVRFEIAYLPGSHHMNLFRTTTDYPDHDEDCFQPMDFSTPTNPGGVDLVVGSQSEALDWKMPAGVAFKLKARTQLVLQTHYVNATTQQTAQGAGEVWVNLHAAPDPKAITAHVGTMFANNMQIVIPPHSHVSFETGCALPQDVNVIAATGHFHSRGKSFEVRACPSDMRAPDASPFYKSQAWNEPPFVVLDQPIPLKAGGGLDYTCEFVNDGTDTITFGPHVENQEHCNLFAYFYPWEEPHARYCF